jgi:hypothetical protein
LRRTHNGSAALNVAGSMVDRSRACIIQTKHRHSIITNVAA